MGLAGKVQRVGGGSAADAWSTDNRAEFTIGRRPTEIAALLDAASEAGLELVDLSLRRPNLESVFLHLTGRELRD